MLNEKMKLTKKTGTKKPLPFLSVLRSGALYKAVKSNPDRNNKTLLLVNAYKHEFTNYDTLSNSIFENKLEDGVVKLQHLYSQLMERCGFGVKYLSAIQLAEKIAVLKYQRLTQQKDSVV